MDSSIAHVRRFLDIISSTISFGPSAQAREETSKKSESEDTSENQETEQSSPENILKGKSEAAEAMAAAAAASEKGDMTGMCPTDSKLGQFYEFLSASHLTPPVQCILHLTCLFSTFN